MNLKFNHITKEYKLDGLTTVIPAKDITLDIIQGEFIIVSGRSGSGKTTLLNMAAGLVNPTSGEVLVDGTNIADMNEQQLSIFRSQKIGFIFQFPSLLPSLTIAENMIVPTIFSSKRNRRESYDRANFLLRTVGLAERKEFYPRQLSAGEQKRAVIARSLINRPELILADEPTSDLDIQTEREIMALLQDINQKGITVVMVTHDLKLVPYATRAFKMDGGLLILLEKI